MQAELKKGKKRAGDQGKTRARIKDEKEDVKRKRKKQKRAKVEPGSKAKPGAGPPIDNPPAKAKKKRKRKGAKHSSKAKAKKKSSKGPKRKKRKVKKSSGAPQEASAARKRQWRAYDLRKDPRKKNSTTHMYMISRLLSRDVKWHVPNVLALLADAILRRDWLAATACLQSIEKLFCFLPTDFQDALLEMTRRFRAPRKILQLLERLMRTRFMHRRSLGMERIYHLILAGNLERCCRLLTKEKAKPYMRKVPETLLLLGVSLFTHASSILRGDYTAAKGGPKKRMKKTMDRLYSRSIDVFQLAYHQSRSRRKTRNVVSESQTTKRFWPSSDTSLEFQEGAKLLPTEDMKRQWKRGDDILRSQPEIFPVVAAVDDACIARHVRAFISRSGGPGGEHFDIPVRAKIRAKARRLLASIFAHSLKLPHPDEIPKLDDNVVSITCNEVARCERGGLDLNEGNFSLLCILLELCVDHRRGSIRFAQEGSDSETESEELSDEDEVSRGKDEGVRGVKNEANTDDEKWSKKKITLKAILNAAHVINDAARRILRVDPTHQMALSVLLRNSEGEDIACSKPSIPIIVEQVMLISRRLDVSGSKDRWGWLQLESKLDLLEKKVSSKELHSQPVHRDPRIAEAYRNLTLEQRERLEWWCRSNGCGNVMSVY